MNTSVVPSLESSFEASDLEQSRLRLIIPLCALAWSIYHPVELHGTHHLWIIGELPTPAVLAVWYFLFGIVVWLMWTPIYKVVPRYARYLRSGCLICDVSAISAYSAVSEEAAVILLPVYLSAIIGYGMRFGPSYLVVTLGLSLIGVLVAAGVNRYLSANIPILLTYLFAIAFVPTYTLILLKRYSQVLSAFVEASQDRELFINVLSHEIRAPLHSIISLAEHCSLQLRGVRIADGTDAFLRTSVQDILRCGERMLAIANRVAGTEARSRSTVKDKADRFPLLYDIYLSIRVCAIYAKRKSLSLTWFIDEGVPSLTSIDSAILQEIIINLLDNAIKHTRSGTVSLHARRLFSNDGSRVLEIAVTDMGPGFSMTPPDPSLVKEHDNSPIARKSAGLGIAIIQRHVARLSGEIEFRPISPSGTRASVRIPLNTVESSERDVSGWLRVLVISDRPLTVQETRLLQGARLFPRFVSEKSDWFTHRSKDPIHICIFMQDQAEVLRRIAQTSEWAEFADFPLLMIGNSNRSAEIYDIHPNMCIDLEAYITSTIRLSDARTILAPYPANAPAIEATHRFSASILIVDDSPLTVESTIRALTSFGHRCTAAMSFDEAQGVIAAREFDVIISDRYLGNVDLLNVLESDVGTRWRSHRIILVTADCNAENEARARGLSPARVMIKPISTTALLNSIDAVCVANAGAHSEADDGSSVIQIDSAVFDDLFSKEGPLAAHCEFLTQFEDEIFADAFRLIASFKALDGTTSGAILHRMTGIARLVGAEGLATYFDLARDAILRAPDWDSLRSTIERIDVAILAFTGIARARLAARAS